VAVPSSPTDGEASGVKRGKIANNGKLAASLAFNYDLPV
jgi:hypothetical protein